MLGPFPHSDASWSALLVRAGREVGRLTREGDAVRFDDPDTGVRARFVHDARGLWIDLPLPAPRAALVEVGEVVDAWPRSVQPALPDGVPWSIPGFVAAGLPALRAALASRPLLAVDDAVVEAAWAWNRARWEKAALYDELFVATAWLVRVGGRVTTAAPWTVPVRTLVPDVEWALIVDPARPGAAVRALRMDHLRPLAEPLDDGLVLAAADPRWAAALGAATEATGFTRVALGEVVERSVLGGGW